MTRDRKLLSPRGLLFGERLDGFHRAEERLEHKTFSAGYPNSPTREMTKKRTALALATVLAFSSTLALAQSGGGGSSGGGSSGSGSSGSGSSGSSASAGGAAAASSAGTSSSYVNGTGGSPGPNTSDALSHGTSGNSMGGMNTSPSASSGTPGGK